MGQDMTVPEGTGHPRPAGKTWHVLRLLLSSRRWNTTCQSLLWSVSAVPLTHAVMPRGRAAGAWLSPAASLASSVHPGITDIRSGKHDPEESVGVRLWRPFHLHCFLRITLLSPNPPPTQSPLQDHTYPASSLVIARLPFLPLEQLLSLQTESGLLLLWGAGRRGKSLNSSPSSSPAPLCCTPPVLGKRWGNAR